MRPPPVVQVQNVSKKFRLFASPKERLLEALHPFRKQYHHEFWALRDISLEVQRGEVVGILGRNGSGKSTLLQIICAVMQATNGEVQVNGRIAALLELGAGFNPEFTGRDNVILNGAILGLSRSEMLRRLPEIEAFADIGEFFDQPVKTYSSGMFVRVAFAAAIHIDPDILIVDEALSVGDAKFQNKCFGKFSDFQKAGKTILFVTHNTNLIPSLCSRAVVFDAGRVMFDGDVVRAVDLYYDLLFSQERKDVVASSIPEDSPSCDTKSDGSAVVIMSGSQTADLCYLRRSYNRHETRFTTHEAEIIDFMIESEAELDLLQIRFGSSVSLFVKVIFKRDVARPLAGFSIKTVDGVEVCGTNTFMMGKRIRRACAGNVYIYKFSFRQCLNPGDYFIDIGIAEDNGTRAGNIIDVRRSIGHFIVLKLDQPTSNGMVDLQPAFEVLDGEADLVLNERRTVEL
jgi:ABC-type polysaccharide/polyol phosphate transport system ATPase subunit